MLEEGGVFEGEGEDEEAVEEGAEGGGEGGEDGFEVVHFWEWGGWGMRAFVG